MKKILLIGSSGSMGNMIKENLKEPYKIVSFIDANNQDIVMDDYYAVLDFSSTKATMKFAPIFISKKIPYICGTTGFKKDEVLLLKDLTNKYGSYFQLVSNFDLTFKEFLIALNNLKPYFSEAIIEEWHCISKVDLPSGTAISISKVLEGLKIRFIVHRVEKVKFIHQVSLISSSKLISLKHIVLNRTSYMKGIIYSLDNISTQGFKEGL